VKHRLFAVLALAGLCGAVGHDDAWAHAGVRFSDPVSGATLGDTPTVVRRSFWEKPEASLSVIHVLDTGGAVCETGPPEPVADDPMALAVRVRPLDTGVYTVSWRTISAVDGHATAGAFAFGVRASPTGLLAAAAVPAPSPFEMLARFLFIAGLVTLLGAVSAGVTRFGGTGALGLGAGGWLLATVGLVLLAEAQRRAADASFAGLLKTAIGRALIWRAVAIAAAGGALLLARWAAPRFCRVAMAVGVLAALSAMALHSAAGHAAAGPWPRAASVGAHWAHFAAVGVWLGGLATLLIGTLGDPSPGKAAAVRRFSKIAAAGLVVVAATGVVRSVDELWSWKDLFFDAYGRVVSVKIALTVAIAAFGALNRWRSVPAAETTLRPLRRTGSGELALTLAALAAAAILGTLPPPERVRPKAPTVLDVSGTDFGTTVRVRLTTGSDQPGPNRFVLQVVDYDSKTPVHDGRVSLRFAPLDDAGVLTTSLPLKPGPGDTYVGSGANLAFDGRWRVTVLIERGGNSVEVPLEVEARSVRQSVSIERVPGQAPKYTVQVTGREFVRISPNPERPGPSQVSVTCFDLFGDLRRIETIVVTAAAGDEPASRLTVRRLEVGQFVADAELRAGRNRIAVVAKTLDGTRIRAAIDLDVPRE